jgi:hypothetical protein
MTEENIQNKDQAGQELTIEDLPVEESKEEEIKAGIRTIALAD